MMERLLRKAWRREGAAGWALYLLLLPASWAYGAAAAIHRAWRRALPKFDCGVPVVIVGNLTVGGTGKTPVAILAAEILRRGGARPVVVSRGHGGRRRTDPAVVADGRAVLIDSASAGDEPVMTARRLPGIPVVVGRDRVAAARMAVDRTGARSLVLDDGFQQRARFPRALRILAVNALDPFGGGALLPAGSLREPARALAEADIIVLTHASEGGGETRALEDAVRARAPRALVVRAGHWITGFADPARSSSVRPAAWVRGRTVLAMAAIADPESFEDRLRACGARIAASCARPDHHRWTPSEVARALEEAALSRAEAIVTTEKDAVRLPVPGRTGVPFLVARMEVRFVTGREKDLFARALGDAVRR